MSRGVELLARSRMRALALGAIAVGAAGCSADSTRFTDGLFAGRSGPSEVTGSVTPGQAAPVGRVEATRLPPPGGASEPPLQSEQAGVAGGSRGLASYRPPAAPSDVTGTVQAPVARKPPPPPPQQQPQWTWDGGTAVTVGQGDSVEAIARRHGVPASAILQANGLAAPAILYPGQRLVIPRPRQAAAPVPAPAPAVPPPRPPMIAAAKPAPVPVPAPAPAHTGATPAPQAPAAAANVHVVAAGDTLGKISRRYHKSVDEIARANNMQPQGKLNVGDRLVIPGVRVSGLPAGEAPKDTPREAAPAAPAAPTNPAAPVAKGTPAQKANAAAKPTTAAPAAETAAMVTPAADPPAAGPKGAPAAATPTFRWPVHGKVIAGFGARPNGQQNDGINVAVPENTPVKAAEDGVVAYAGSELKGYGNLVLVRHSNGYVTAYAHAKELMVKRGDTVKRGQVIAKSGQTGNVDAPQLHFEVRKGPAPQDPMPMLNGG
jgi:murein DD-endopeptidase MepM/ murein hydrolase activator NlpD